MTKDIVKRDLILKGNLWSVVALISFPVVMYGLINAFFSVFDALIVSKIGPNEVSAVAILFQIKNLLSSLALGLGAGGSVVISRYLGAGNYEFAKKTTNTLVSLTLLLSVILISICLLFSTPIMRISGVSEDLIKIGKGYFIVSILELFFLFFNTIFLGIQKSKGSTKSILYLNLTGMIIKVIFSLIFVYGYCVTNVIWVAFATLLGQFFISVFAVLVLCNKSNILRVSIKEFNLNWFLIKKILIISIPIFIGKFLFAFGKVFINSICLSYGGLMVGALSVSGNINHLGVGPVNAFEEIESGIVSQNVGNNNYKRAMQTFTRTLIYSLSLACFFFILIRVVFLDQIMYLFTMNNKETDNILFLESVRVIFKCEVFSMFGLAINAAVLGLFYGFGKTKTTMLLNLANLFAFRIPFILLAQKFMPSLGIKTMGLAVTISNNLVAVIGLILVFIFFKKLKKQELNVTL